MIPSGPYSNDPVSVFIATLSGANLSRLLCLTDTGIVRSMVDPSGNMISISQLIEGREAT